MADDAGAEDASADAASAREDEDAAAAGGNVCPMCGAQLFKRHCKYVCPQHGVVVDCSDPFSF